MPADRLVKIPAGVSDEQAAVLMLKGMTACYLLRHTYRVKRGDVIVVHAAAGGVGSLLSQWGRALGAIVIGIVGSDDKATLAKKNGCRHVLMRGRDDIAAAVKKLSKGQGAHVVYDGVGKDTFTESLDSLRKRGLMVSYGNASGPVPPFSVAELVKRGSLYVTRPTLFDYTVERARPGVHGARNLRGAEEEVDEAPDYPALQAGRRRAGASRPRVAQDHGRIGHSAGLSDSGAGGRWPRTSTVVSTWSMTSFTGSMDAFDMHAMEMPRAGKWYTLAVNPSTLPA